MPDLTMLDLDQCEPSHMAWYSTCSMNPYGHKCSKELDEAGFASSTCCPAICPSLAFPDNSFVAKACDECKENKPHGKPSEPDDSPESSETPVEDAGGHTAAIVLGITGGVGAFGADTARRYNRRKNNYEALQRMQDLAFTENPFVYQPAQGGMVGGSTAADADDRSGNRSIAAAVRDINQDDRDYILPDSGKGRVGGLDPNDSFYGEAFDALRDEGLIGDNSGGNRLNLDGKNIPFDLLTNVTLRAPSYIDGVAVLPSLLDRSGATAIQSDTVIGINRRRNDKEMERYKALQTAEEQRQYVDFKLNPHKRSRHALDGFSVTGGHETSFGRGNSF